MAGLDPKAWINLGQVSVVLVDGNDLGMQILKQIFAGLGVRNPHCFNNATDVLEFARHNEINLIVANDILPDMTGYEMVRRLRRAQLEPNSFSPVVITRGHTKKSQVKAARDCGANFVVAKPMSPQVMLERVVWVSQESRPFVDTGVYLGPDRRFKEVDEDANPSRRRSDPEPVVARDPVLDGPAFGSEKEVA